MGRISKAARWLGLVGGVGAALWAARDRFISLTLPSEPEPPVFRSAEEAQAAAQDDLTRIAGIGPVFADRLGAEGVSTFRALSERSSDQIAGITGASATRAAGWIAEAKHLVEEQTA